MPGQQQAAEQQAAGVHGAHFLPAGVAGETGEAGQGNHGEGRPTEDDDGGGSGGKFAEHTGQAKHQCADMQGAKGGTRSHCNP
ncbi:hypothetical protein D3C80_1476830 [compost metagenome]